MKTVLLLIDGLGYVFLHKQRTPFWKAHSRKLTNVEPTITVPNWASILSGKKPEEHGIMKNEQVSYRRGKRYPLTTLCDDFQTVMITDWKPMQVFTDGFVYCFKNVFDVFCDIYNKHPDAELFILNTDLIDATAHKQGWGSKAFYRKASMIDRETQKLYDFLKQQQEPFLLLGTADHGGFRKNHEAAHHDSIRQVPFLSISSDTSFISPRLRKTTGIRRWLRKTLK